MPINVNSFVIAADKAWLGNRDLAVTGGENPKVKLGNRILSQGQKLNKATMDAFRAALDKEYGSLGTNAFDTILGQRAQLRKSLRACDVKATLSSLPQLRENRFVSEANRQLDIHPSVLTLPEKAQQKLRMKLHDDPIGDVKLEELKSPADVSVAVSARIKKAIDELRDDPTVDTKTQTLDARKDLSPDVKPTDPTGLRNLKLRFDMRETSIADKLAKGLLGDGIRVNRSSTSPVLLESLKSNGVEPGFIYRNDWSASDTRGYMTDINSAESRKALDDLKTRDPAFAAKCEGKTLREQILLAGRAHPASIAAASELLLSKAADYALKNGVDDKGQPLKASDAVKNLAQALRKQFGSEVDLKAISTLADSKRAQDALKEAKQYLFVQIRDAVMSVKPTDDEYKMSNVFKHFADHAIVKLDYNESDKFSSGETAHEGTFMRPERVAVNRKMGQLYRFQTRAGADSISAGAVTEALANDLTRLAGVPSQELEIVRGEYSDGHPKIMLAAKFATGYKDLEAGMLKDGRVVKPAGADPNLKMESLGKYKAFFLVTADRDGVGSRGQNKGFVGGQFFAIDPGHSLEGNGKYLKVSDDLSFKDTYGHSSKPRFNNFSVFDDDTRFSKLEGVLKMREIYKSGAFQKVFDDYRKAFDPNEKGISPAEKALREKIIADIGAKETEFTESVKKLLDVCAMQLEFYDSLKADGPEMQEKAIETLGNLEKLTSPTTWVSKKGQVELTHLEVKPETRVQWRAGVDIDDNLVYHCDTPLDGSLVEKLEAFAKAAGVKYEYDNFGSSTITVPKDKAAEFFKVFDEEKVAMLTHPEEYAARKKGVSSLKIAKDYKPLTFKNIPSPLPPLKPDQLPPSLDVEFQGRVVKMPKIHYEGLVASESDDNRPRNIGELRASITARIKRGVDILNSLREGRVSRFEPSRGNIVALTFALHAGALAKGEFMYRGSFSVADPDGNIARWLDKAEGIYLRTSTHAKTQHSLTVDGHLNMPRGYDVPTGMGGLLNGMRTFHYFTIPDPDHMQDAGGSGPKRRLFLKCETFGIFCSTANFHPGKKKSAKTEGMNTRSYKFGDFIESVFHGSSLLASFFTPKDAPGIRKENLPKPLKDVIDVAEANLRAIGEERLADKLVDAVKGHGAGVRQLMDNMGEMLENLPADDVKRAEVTEILDAMIVEMERVSGGHTGVFDKRMGNEIMID